MNSYCPLKVMRNGWGSSTTHDRLHYLRLMAAEKTFFSRKSISTIGSTFYSLLEYLETSREFPFSSWGHSESEYF